MSSIKRRPDHTRRARTANMRVVPERTGVPTRIDDPPSRAIAIQLPAELSRYARTTTRWRPGCEVTVLRDGVETYAAMLAAIGAAQTSICFETYILAADDTGDRFKAALIDRARAGVTVRLMFDAVGSFGLPGAWLGELREAGITIVEYNPIAPWRARFRMSHRDHRKTLIIDDLVAFTGGLNIANEYAPEKDGVGGWHDMHCRVRGPIVADIGRGFRRTWIRAGGSIYPAPSRTDGAAGGSIVRLLENTRRRSRTAIRRAYLHVIKAARDRVLIQNAYFLPDRGLRRALIRAAKRGVDVRVIVPGHSDVALVGWATLYAMRTLARRGIRFLLWQGAMMHAKTAVVDATWSTIGSYNFDAQSRFNNLELTVEILDPRVGTELARQFDGDAPQCVPFDTAAWTNLPWWRKAFAWLAFRLRRFL